jgi:hypothetical protein
MKTQEIHSEDCNCNKLSEEALSFNSYNYFFYYKLKKVIVHVNACMHSYSGTPHSEILEIAIRKIREIEGVECKPEHTYEVRPLRGPLRDFFAIGTVLESVKTGSFGYEYFITHKSDSDFVKENLKNLYVV